MDNYFYREVEKLTRELVSIESIVKNGSESKVAKYIYDYYSKLEYFKNQPQHLLLQRTKNDEIERYNTICLLKGEGSSSDETVVLMGHMDTVGVEDFNSLKEYAFSPDTLLEKLKSEDLDTQTQKDLNSGNFLFGRGALDMKSGVAVQMAIIKYYSENLGKLNGNLLAIAECDEEDSSRGIVTALEILNTWKSEYNLNYLLAVNSDFTTPMYDGDDNKYVYLGTVGKLLPSFYIAGVETHVGKAFGGLNPNMVAAEINCRLDLNTKYCDVGQNEVTQPPVCLQLRDLKPEYDVQTPSATNSYYNYSTHSSSPLDVIEKLRNLSRESAESLLKNLNEEYKKWCELSNSQYNGLDWEIGVFTWKEYEDKLIKEYGKDYIDYISDYKKNLDLEFPDLSIPEFSLKVVNEAYSKFSKGNDPVIIIYYGSPYYQNVEILGRNEEEKRIIESLESTIEDAKEYSSDNIKLKHFYPYISDSSFMYLPKSELGINSFKDNFPTWGSKYEHPVEKIRRISMPVVNIGTFGNDGHKFTERVDKSYTFGILPKLIVGFLDSLLER